MDIKQADEILNKYLAEKEKSLCPYCLDGAAKNLKMELKDLVDQIQALLE